MVSVAFMSVQRGKFLKRLDNHLSRKHKGVTRGMNDKQPVLQQPGKLRVTCQLPGCGKEVIHLSQHLKNMHSLSDNAYHLQVNRGQKKK